MRLTDTSRLVTRKAQPLSDFARLMRRLHIDGPLVVTPEISNESENAVAHCQQLYLNRMGETT